MKRPLTLFALIASLLLLSMAAGTSSAQTVLSVSINFQPAASATPAGYTADTGLPYGARGGGLTFGWVQEGNLNAPVDMSGESRERTINWVTGSVRDRTIIQMQRPAGATTLAGPRGAWQFALNNGMYRVTVGVGDRQFTDSTNQINVEGTPLLTFTPTTTNQNRQATADITVSDGQLTVDAIGGTNTKINFVQILELEVTTDPNGNVTVTAPVVSVPNEGTIGISTPTILYTTPNGPVADDSNGDPITLPVGTTYVVTDTQVVDGETWVSIFLGSADYGWLRLSDVDALTAITGVDFDNLPEATTNAASQAGGDTPVVLEGGYAIVNTNRLNVRSGDGANYSVEGILVGGEELSIIGRNLNGSWYYITNGAVTGWVNAGFIVLRGNLTGAPVQSAADTNATMQMPSFFVFSSTLIYETTSNLRSYRLCEIAGNTEYPVIARNGDSTWYLLETSCGEGWIQTEMGGLRNLSAPLPVR